MKAASSGKQANHHPQAQALCTYTVSIIFTSWTPNKNLLGRIALKRSTSFPRRKPKKRIAIKKKISNKNSFLSTPYSINEGSAAFPSHPGSLAESTVGAAVSHPCAAAAPSWAWPRAGSSLLAMSSQHLTSISQIHLTLLPWGSHRNCAKGLGKKARMTACVEK